MRRRAAGGEFSGDLFEIVPSGEHLARSAKRHNADCIIVCSGIQQLLKLLLQSERDGISRSGPIDDHFKNRAVGLDQEVVVVVIHEMDIRSPGAGIGALNNEPSIRLDV
jgi:hypothetical protein